ncbi:asparagine synthase family protein [Caulobacter rhizosphaerae]|uniref:asparagine synthase-related protein n=1 Tax=Caulobacter rhizosphaerae TaxID=2010972 RepID=UPI0013D0C246|nr:asparagine synthetase B family protein [Caulobacter rhizosphaerae]GGL36016.1 asparagine synthase [Caulobacter rhizosphaerae]
MRGDYVVILGEGPLAKALRHSLQGFKSVLEAPGVLVLAEPTLAVAALGERGVVLGAVFAKTSQALPVTAFSPSATVDIVQTAGQWLIDNVWGGYLAVIADPASGEVQILRDPSGALPSYRLRHEGLTVFCSRLDLVLEAGLSRPVLDWASVGQILAYPHLRGRRTGLRSVDELLPGERATVRSDHGTSWTSVWSPWPFADPAAAFTTPEEAARAVREAVDRSVQAWASISSPLILELSGGLDSSIIAVALADTPAATFVNFHTQAAEADERNYARKAAQAAGHGLVERLVDVSGVDVRRARPGRHARPAAQALLQPMEAVFAQMGRDGAAAAYFSGLGGDNVFCSLATAAPATDALLSFGPGRRFLAALADLAQLHQASLWEVVRLAALKAVRLRRGLGVAPITTLLTPDAEVAAPDHPWLDAPAGMPPGKQEHVASILVAQGFLDRYEHAAVAPVCFPLLSQPVLEACLRVPTWMAIRGGRNRAVARDAFADRLPAEIYRRQTKSGLNVFMGAVFDRNRAALAEQLVRGWLATAGLIDGRAVREILEAPAPGGLDMTRVLYFADVEAWARTWGQT